MTCPRCSADLPDTTAFCPICGSSITQSGVLFSYLPTGTPPWPTNVLERPNYGTDAMISPAQSMQQEESLPATKVVAKPRPSTQRILFIVALFLLTPLIGVGTTLGILWANGDFPPNARPAAVHVQIPSQQTPVTGGSLTPTTSTQGGNQLPTPASFQTTHSAQVGISIQYPADWVQDPVQSTPSGNISVNFHPQQQLPVDLGIGRLSNSNSASVKSTDEVNSANIQGFGSNNQGLKNLQALTSAPQHPNIGGTPWDEQDATYTTDSGTIVHVTSISVKHNGLYYNIFYFAPSTVYGEAMQKYYSQMLQSFQFNS